MNFVLHAGRKRSAAVSKTNRSAWEVRKAPGVCGVLRLVEDDTAALRIFGVEGRTDTRAVTLMHELQGFPLVELQLLARRRARIYVLFAEVLP